MRILLKRHLVRQIRKQYQIGRNRRAKTGGKQKAGTAGVNEHLRFDDSAVDVVSSGSRISRTASHAVTGTLAGRVHHEIAENEDDNVVYRRRIRAKNLRKALHGLSVMSGTVIS